MLDRSTRFRSCAYILAGTVAFACFVLGGANLIDLSAMAEVRPERMSQRPTNRYPARAELLNRSCSVLNSNEPWREVRVSLSREAVVPVSCLADGPENGLSYRHRLHSQRVAPVTFVPYRPLVFCHSATAEGCWRGYEHVTLFRQIKRGMMDSSTLRAIGRRHEIVSPVPCHSRGRYSAVGRS